MWRRRNSLSHFTQIATSSSSKFNCHLNLQPTSIRLLQIADVDHGYAGLISRSSSTAVGPSSGSAKLGISGLDRVRAIGATADVVEATTLGAREVVDMARHYGRCYWELSKAKLSMLVVATSGAGYVLGSGSTVDLAGLCYTCAGTMMVAASANTLNQVFEVKNDALMNRTRRRPLPSGRLTIPHAVTWASSVGIAGTALLATKANLLAAGLGASNLVLYAFVYTPLKQIHPVNTWVGAVVGAIPPLLGWAAASGQISLNGWILPAALYFWQIPHFMALAYLCRDDYAAGGFKMFSLADPSGRRTALVALRNCIYLIPLGYLAYDWGITSGWFCLESTLLALAISGTAVSFLLNRTKTSARRMFHASLLYLPVFMSGLMFHRVYDDHQALATENTKEKMSCRVDFEKNGKPGVQTLTSNQETFHKFYTPYEFERDPVKKEETRLRLFSGTANPTLSQEIACYMGLDLGDIKIKRFADGEIYVQLRESVRGCDVFLVQPTCPPANENLMELLVMIDACRRASAKTVTAVIPYFGYARADRKSQGRESIAAKLVANLITEAGADRVLACDLHSGQSIGYFDIPVDHVHGQPVILDYLASKSICFEDLVVVSPDVGGVARARAFAKKLSDAPLAIVDKRRHGHNSADVMNLIGDVKGKVAVMVDDMIDTAGTISKGAALLHHEGAREVYACCTHAVFSPPAIERLSSGLFQEVIITNTIPVSDQNCFPQLTILSVANLLGEAIWRVHDDYAGAFEHFSGLGID